VNLYQNFQGVWLVSSDDDFRSFFKDLARDDRPPVVVVTLSRDDGKPLVDLKRLRESIDALITIYVLTAHASRLLTDSVGRDLSSFWGYLRIYGPYSKWRGEPNSLAISTVVPIPGNVEIGTDRAIDLAYRQQLSQEQRTVVRQQRRGENMIVEVTDVSAQMISVRHTSTGTNATFKPSELWPGIDGRRLVKKKMQLTGTMTGEGVLLREFHPNPPIEDVRTRALTWIDEGRPALVLVEAFTEGAVVVRLHPDLVLNIPVREGQDPASLTRPGQVIAVYALCDGDYIEVDFTAVVTTDSMSVLPGGPPWLLPEAETPPLAQEDITQHFDEMVFSLEEARNQVGMLTSQVLALQAQVDELQRALRAAQRDIPRFFSDEERQVRYELEHYYLAITSESDRKSYPWPERYELGPNFVETLRELTDSGSISRRKVLEKCAQVLSGRDFDLGISKPWKKPGSSQETREDRALAYRTQLEGDIPGSRRLKYWLHTDRHIELASVGHHDEGLE
jgi:hypothetical protein